MVGNENPVPLPPYETDPTSLYVDFFPEDVQNRPGFKGWFAVVNSRGRIRWTMKEDKGLHLLNFVSHKTPPSYLSYLRGEHIPYIVAGEERVDLCEAMEKLKSKLDVRCVLSTAGGMLNGALLRAGLVNEINIEFFPAVIGGFRTPKLFDSRELQPDELPARLSLVSATVLANGHVWLRGESGLRVDVSRSSSLLEGCPATWVFPFLVLECWVCPFLCIPRKHCSPKMICYSPPNGLLLVCREDYITEHCGVQHSTNAAD